MFALQMPPGNEAGSAFPTGDYDRLRAHLSRAVSRVCPRLFSDRREDLVQDCLLRVMDVVRKSEGQARLTSSYLYKVAYSVLIDEIRRVRRRRETPLEEDGEPAQAEAITGNPEDAAAGREIGNGILDCLGRLLRERRLSVTLYLQGHSVVEAAAILDWPAKKTENFVYRGLADLRNCLAAKGIKP
jgi:RNA polymerase sigma-70 factor, ECF subfamily